MTVRRLFMAVYATLIVGLLGLGGVAYQMLQSQKELSASQHVRYRSYLAADELRQSSDDLTRMARTYVSTGDSTYEDEYWHILDVRNGKSPRPDGQAVALRKVMEELGFTDEEFAKLKEAEDNSNDLVWTETVAMNAVKGLFDDGTGKFTKKGDPDFKLARRIMFDDKYHADKTIIMGPIDEFVAMLDARTKSDVRRHASTSMLFLWTIVGMIVLLIGIAGFSYWLIQRKVVSPVAELVREIQLMGDGDLTREVRGSAKGEIGDLAQAINGMARDLSDIVRQIGTTSAKMEAASKEQAVGATNQSTATTEMATTARELLTTAQQVAKSGISVSEQASTAATDVTTMALT